MPLNEGNCLSSMEIEDFFFFFFLGGGGGVLNRER